MQEAARAVGVSDRQLRRRIGATMPLLAPHVRRGEKNRLLLNQNAIEILRAVEQERSNGRTVEEATAYVADSIDGNHRSEQGRASGQTIGQTPETSGLVGELRARIAFLERENDRLWGLVDDLKALPAPRTRQPWWIRVFGFASTTTR